MDTALWCHLTEIFSNLNGFTIASATEWWKRPLNDFEHGIDEEQKENYEPKNEENDYDRKENTDGEKPSARQPSYHAYPGEPGEGGSFEDFYRVHTITLFDKVLFLNHRDARSTKLCNDLLSFIGSVVSIQRARAITKLATAPLVTKQPLEYGKFGF